MIQARFAKRVSEQLLLDVEFVTGPGITALFGSSKAGKTAVLECIAGFLTPDRGRILIDDRIVYDGGSGVDAAPRLRRCAYVMSQDSLFPHMTVWQNLMFAAGRYPRLERHRRVGEVLERFELTHAAGQRANGLSPAEKGRCTVARAVLSDPAVLLLDEPSSAWQAVIGKLREQEQRPVLLATRNVDVIFALADAMLVLHRGRVLQHGAPREVLDRPANPEVARLLGIDNVFEARIQALDPARNTSRLQLDSFELTGPYFPGRLLGDRVWLCVRAGELRASAANGAKPGTNQIPSKLQRVWEKPVAVMLEFSNGIRVELPQREFAREKDNKDWIVEFPPNSVRIL